MVGGLMGFAPPGSYITPGNYTPLASGVQHTPPPTPKSGTLDRNLMPVALFPQRMPSRSQITSTSSSSQLFAVPPPNMQLNHGNISSRHVQYQGLFATPPPRPSFEAYKTPVDLQEYNAQMEAIKTMRNRMMSIDEINSKIKKFKDAVKRPRTE